MGQLLRPAVRIEQGGLTLYATSLRVRDLKQKNFCKIDTLDPYEKTGFQRVLNEARAKRLAEYLLSGQKSAEAFLPTSMFLATDRSLSFDQLTNVLDVNHASAGPFNVVDGQHRLRGLILASEKEPALEDFEVSVNIGVNLSSIAQMAHFLIVNTTQKAVDKAIEQQIVARLTQMVETETTPVLPNWIKRQVDKGEDARALAIVDFLNTAPGSVWRGKIRMANDEQADEATVNQKSFVTSLKKHILTPAHPIAGEGWEIDKQQRVLLNYWNSIADLLVETDDPTSIIFKTNGLIVFHSVSQAIFVHLANLKDFRQETVRLTMRRAFENLPADYMTVANPTFWKRGSTASGLNTAAARKYAHAISRALNTSADSEGAIF